MRGFWQDARAGCGPARDWTTRGSASFLHDGAARQAQIAISKKDKENAMARYGRKSQEKVEEAMHEYKRGQLKSSSGQKVTNPKQAVAIGLSEARSEGGKVPPAKKAAGKKTTAKRASAKKTTAKKTAVKKTTARKTTAKKAPAKKSTARKTTAKKTAAKKSTGRKTTAKKTAARKSSARKKS
jgi:hypothetical protein